MAKRASKTDDTSESSFDITAHVLVPKHEICSATERAKVIENYGVSEQQLPRMLATDAGIAHLGAKRGDLIKITRTSPTAGETIFYRIVTQE